MLASEFIPMAQKSFRWQNTVMQSDEFVRRLRQRIESDEDLTASGLAKRAGVDNSTIRKMLSIDGASPRLETARRICKALGTTYEAFMSDPDDPLSKEILDLYTQLKPSERQMLIAAAKGLVSAGQAED